MDYLIDSEYKRVTALTRKPKPRMLKIDWFTLPASAGTGNILDSDLAEDLFVPESAEAEQADFVISVGDDSLHITIATRSLLKSATLLTLVRSESSLSMAMYISRSLAITA